MMISSISQPTFLSSASVQNPTGGAVNSVDTLKSQASISVPDTSKFQPAQPASTPASNTTGKESANSKPVEASQSTTELSAEAKQVIDQLKARDAEVRAHEQAHLSAAGGHATGGASYSYQVGPDGQRYAIGGEVGIDVSPVAGDPEATLLKANVVQRAALAPAEPSSQDMRVASAAMQMASEARMEIASQSTEDLNNLNSSENGDDRWDEVSNAEQESRFIQPNLSMQENQGLFDRNGFDLRMQLQPMA